jgi:hypothetical protein
VLGVCEVGTKTHLVWVARMLNISVWCYGWINVYYEVKRDKNISHGGIRGGARRGVSGMGAYWFEKTSQEDIKF